MLVSDRKKGGVRIMRAPSQTGEPSAPRHAPVGDATGEAPREAKPDFHSRKSGPGKFDGKKFGQKKFGGRKFGKKKPGAQSN